MKKLIVFACLFVFLISSLLASTQEAQPSVEVQAIHNFWQEFDITFWQGLPWITIWTHFAERQIAAQARPGAEANWSVIVSASTVLSAINAYSHARKVMNDERTRHSH